MGSSYKPHIPCKSHQRPNGQRCYIPEILSYCSNVSTKTFHLPAAHWAAVSQFSRHFHIVQKKVFKHSFSQNILIFKVIPVKKNLSLQTFIFTKHAHFQGQTSQKKLKKLITYLYQFIRKKKATKKQPKAKFSKLTYK